MPPDRVRRSTRIPEKFPCGCVCIYRNPKTKNHTYGSGMSVTLEDGRKICRCGIVWKLVWQKEEKK